jgi:hypothetical protein
MDEHEFDSRFPMRPFERKDALTRAGRTAALGAKLWGMTPDDLQRQLLASSPAMPSGFCLHDYRNLQRLAEMALRDFTTRGRQHPLAPLGATIILAGTQRYTVLEARCEIVRRAIARLENS